MAVTRTRVLEESWTADQIENEPTSVLGAAVRGVAGTAGAGAVGPAIALRTLPYNVKARRRYVSSIYGQPIATDPATGDRYTVNWGVNDAPWLAVWDVSSQAWWNVYNLRLITGDPFGALIDDSHNTMAVAVHEGVIHVWGNMHTEAMKYARTDATGNPATFTAASFGSDSANYNSVTYAQGFIAGGELFAVWRNGSSSSGKFMLKRFAVGPMTWSSSTVIADGDVSDEGPYPSRILIDGTKIGFAMTWRLDSTAASNSGFTYIEADVTDLVWKHVDGTPQSMPMTHANSTNVYPLNAGSGFINQMGGTFDYFGHPHLFMTLYDSDGNFQYYDRHWDGAQWRTEQLTHFTSTIDTSGTTLYLSTSRADGFRFGKRIYLVGKTLYDGGNGAPFLIDATPGADHSRAPLANLDLAGWEPSCIDQQGVDAGYLNLFLNSVDQIADSELNWDRQWAGLYTLRLDAVDQLIRGGIRLPTISSSTYTDWPMPVAAVGGTADASVETKLPRTQVSGGGRRFAKGTVLFARVRARVTFETGTTSTTLYLRASPSGGAQDAVDVSKMVAANTTLQGLFETPWEPIPLYVETDGTRRDTILTPRAIADNAAGIRVEGYTVEIGVLDA